MAAKWLSERTRPGRLARLERSFNFAGGRARPSILPATWLSMVMRRLRISLWSCRQERRDLGVEECLVGWDSHRIAGTVAVQRRDRAELDGCRAGQQRQFGFIVADLKVIVG